MEPMEYLFGKGMDFLLDEHNKEIVCASIFNLEAQLLESRLRLQNMCKMLDVKFENTLTSEDKKKITDCIGQMLNATQNFPTSNRIRLIRKHWIENMKNLSM